MSKGLLNSMVLKNLFEDVDGAELLPSLIESGVITKEQVEEYYKANIKSQKAQKPTYSTIKDGVLVKFDDRDLVNGGYVTPVGVHTIGEGAFAQCNTIFRVKLRRDIKRIKKGAFISCHNLESVQMTNSVRWIDEDAFNSCMSLTDLKLSSNLKEISLCTFANCTHLQQVELPEKLEVINDYAFSWCDNLNRISSPPESLIYVSEEAFEQTPIGRDFMRLYHKHQEEQNQEKGNVK